jgi:hypothetical protein
VTEESLHQDHNYTVRHCALAKHKYAMSASQTPPSMGKIGSASFRSSPASFPNTSEQTVPPNSSSIPLPSDTAVHENSMIHQASGEDKEVSAENNLMQECRRSGPICPAGDPEIEVYKDELKNTRKNQDIPLVTWVLVSLFLLSAVQKTATESLVGEMSQLYADSQRNGHRRNKPYSKRIMIFCMTLAGYSAKAYRYLRSSVNYCIPSPETLKNYRNRVDGSPGFSSAALKMVKSKVIEVAETSRKLFLSLSCDDISIRCIFCKAKLQVHYF